MPQARSLPAVLATILAGLAIVCVALALNFLFRDSPETNKPDDPGAVTAADGNEPQSDGNGDGNGDGDATGDATGNGDGNVPDADRDGQSEFARRTGSFFSPAPTEPYGLPQVVELWTPPLKDDAAIWGATGRDVHGRIWYGVSTGNSARLFELDPNTNESFARGDVLTSLKSLGLYEEGMSQTKIHTRIVQADDGFLYFASMDEHGEAVDGSRLPDHGSHIWRLKPGGQSWEHVQAVPEALIAMSGGGRWVYALGYFGHVLYQLDTQTSEVRSTRIGSVGGHASRNFLADPRGHAYVPRMMSNDEGTFAATLVELDATLRELGETPLKHYFAGDPRTDRSHGITGAVYLADESMVFTTHLGFLYRIVPQQEGPAEVMPLGWFHPDGSAEAESLFTYAGRRYLLGVARRQGKPYQWLVYDLISRSSRAVDLRLVDLITPPRKNTLLFGSMTRDDLGRFYIVGRYHRNGIEPLILQVHAP